MDWLRLIATAVLAMLAISDLRARRLPNAAVAALAGLYFIGAGIDDALRAALAAHALTAVAALMLAAGLFRIGWLGGGDAKLAAVIFLWSGPVHATRVFFIVSVSGLMLGMAVLAAGVLARRSVPAHERLGWVAPARGVPYGVALALGGLAAVWPSAPTAHAKSGADIRTTAVAYFPAPPAAHESVQAPRQPHPERSSR